MSRKIGHSAEDAFPLLLMGSLFVAIDGLALLATSPLDAAGVTAFDNPSDPLNLLYFFVTLVVFTVAILLISRLRRRNTLHGILLGAIGLIIFDTIYSLIGVEVADPLAFGLSAAVSVGLVVTLFKYPEWYVVDSIGVIAGAGAAAIIGISLSISLIIVLLVGMAVYDAISVYKTKHMIDLADAVMTLKVPMMLVVPKTRSYSLIKEDRSLKEKIDKGEEREAFFMGLGDIIFPGILFVSTYYNVPTQSLLVALSVLAGTLVSFIALMASALKGKPQAGLPYLSTGAILGYAMSSYLLFGGLVGLTI
jgi:presenilin-like A22 family membrane protease